MPAYRLIPMCSEMLLGWGSGCFGKVGGAPGLVSADLDAILTLPLFAWIIFISFPFFFIFLEISLAS